VIISSAGDRNRDVSVGAAAVLQKPVSRDALVEALIGIGLYPPVPGHMFRVLVVDDEPKAVELIAVRLQGLAATVERAYGGREAIEAVRRERPDLIVLDLMMPEVNGFDVVEALLKQPHTAGIPILVVTAKQITSEDRGRLGGNVTNILRKAEFDTYGFLTEVRRAMAGRQRVSHTFES
jgi:CheY-like chemotaxis protein